MAGRLPDIPEGGFKDWKGFENWLNGLEKANQVAIEPVLASRTAMRVSVLVAEDADSLRFPRLTLAVLRANLVVRIALKYPSLENGEAAANAANAANTAARVARGATTAADAIFAAAAANTAARATRVVRGATDTIFASYATHTAAAFAAAAFAAKADIWASLTADCRATVAGGEPRELINRPLWPGEVPQWWHKVLSLLKEALARQSPNEAARQGWRVWLDWLQDVAAGKRPWGLPPETSRELQQRIALGDGRSDFWDREPDAINAEIAGWLKEAGWRAGEKSDETPIQIPALEKATLAPEWVDGKLQPVDRVTPANLLHARGSDAFQGLKTAVEAFHKQISEDTNVDKRFVKLIERLIEAFPNEEPNQRQLFAIGPYSIALRQYWPKAQEEWEETAVSLLYAVTIQLERILDKYPEWKELEQSEPIDPVTAESSELLVQVANAMIAPLSEGPVAEELAAQLQELANTVPAVNPVHSSDALLPRDASIRSFDLLRSINNTLKQILLPALWIKGKAVQFAGFAWENFSKEVSKEAAAQFQKLGKETVVWAFRVLKVTLPLYGGKYLWELIVTHFPNAASWLPSVLKVLGL